MTQIQFDQLCVLDEIVYDPSGENTEYKKQLKRTRKINKIKKSDCFQAYSSFILENNMKHMIQTPDSRIFRSRRNWDRALKMWKTKLYKFNKKYLI